MSGVYGFDRVVRFAVPAIRPLPGLHIAVTLVESIPGVGGRQSLAIGFGWRWSGGVVRIRHQVRGILPRVFRGDPMLDFSGSHIGQSGCSRIRRKRIRTLGVGVGGPHGPVPRINYQIWIIRVEPKDVRVRGEVLGERNISYVRSREMNDVIGTRHTGARGIIVASPSRLRDRLLPLPLLAKLPPPRIRLPAPVIAPIFSNSLRFRPIFVSSSEMDVPYQQMRLHTIMFSEIRQIYDLFIHRRRNRMESDGR